MDAQIRTANIPPCALRFFGSLILLHNAEFIWKQFGISALIFLSVWRVHSQALLCINALMLDVPGVAQLYLL